MRQHFVLELGRGHIKVRLIKYQVDNFLFFLFWTIKHFVVTI